MKTKNKIPMRQCTGCREMKNKKEMIRVLKTAEDEIVLDVTGKKNGRGAYICFFPGMPGKSKKEPRTGAFFEGVYSGRGL